MLKIYTKTGDAGETSLIGGRKSKSAPQVMAYGTVDELNAQIGLTLTKDGDKWATDVLSRIQQELFSLAGEIALGENPGREVPKISQTDISQLEKDIDEATKQMPELKNFIIPGGSGRAAHLQVCRTVCRRAERYVVKVQANLRADVLQYLNRMSDLLFTLARFENFKAGIKDQIWKG